MPSPTPPAPPSPEQTSKTCILRDASGAVVAQTYVACIDCACMVVVGSCETTRCITTGYEACVPGECFGMQWGVNGAIPSQQPLV